MAKIKTFTSVSFSPLICVFLLFFSFSFASGRKTHHRESSKFQFSPHGPHRHYMNSVRNATQLPRFSSYDFIIVGGGAAGCPLAATLSKHFKVLLLERGGNHHDYPQTATQDGFLQLLMEAGRNISDYPAQSFTSLDGVSNVRGRVLGGSSSINAGFYTRAHRGFFKAGAHAGIKWDMGLVNASYEWVERKVAFKPRLNRWQSAFADGLLEANVTPFNGFSYEHMAGTKIGGTTFSPDDGRRHSAAELLDYADLKNLKVALHASVEKILLRPSPGGLKKPYAKGVMYRDLHGHAHYAFLRRHGEVILSSGAIGSPHLLLLSGIGPPSLLNFWSIPVIFPHPFVGHFLTDNPRTGVTIISPVPVPTSLIQVVGISDSGFYLEASTSNIPLHLHPHLFAAFPNLNLTLATIMQKLSNPISTGSLWLASKDVRVNPVVQFNYFANPIDMERCMDGMRTIAEVMKSPEMEGFKFPMELGGKGFKYMGPEMACDGNELQLEELCKRSLTTIWHYHGGCLVGKVVDPEYRVIGVDSLRVVDGSTFAISPGTNPQATVMMLGRYMGSQITKEKLRRK